MKAFYRFMFRQVLWIVCFSLVMTACTAQVMTQPVEPSAASSQAPASSPTAAVQPSLSSTRPAVPSNTLASPTPTPGPAKSDSPQWKLIANGLQDPVDLADPGDGSGRLFILEKPGRIRILKNGAILPAALLDITDRVGSSGSEQGLLGIALHPSFKTSGFFYVNYTDLKGNTVIARFTISSNPDQADAQSEKVLLRVNQPFPNHNGGSMVFGPDGYLYMGLGDGGSQGDPHLNGQSKNTFLGKILRIDVDQGDPYAIPADNPFAKGGGLPEIWAYGLRNPWRFSFDRQTGDMYIADVGQNLYEEIDYLPAKTGAGTDFGWSYREGLHPYKGSPPAGVKLTDPVWEYTHDFGCSITGGFVYRGKAVPSLQGTYMYGDYCSGRVWGLKRGSDGKWQSSQLFQTGLGISSFGQDQAGEIYLLDLIHGGVYQLQ